MMNFLSQYWFHIAMGLGIVAFVLYVYSYKGNKAALLARVALSAVTFAEEKYGDKTGALKFTQAAIFIQDNMPPFAKMLFSEKDINQAIENALVEFKQLLTEQSKQ